MTINKRVELYQRLPEIYRIKDSELPENFLRDGKAADAYQLRSFLEPVEEMFSAIHENIESLYHDLFIETCDEWVIPYIGDLLGTSHLSGDQWTLRADVADTILLRRSKGTLGAIELLAFILTRWGVHAVEMRENMVWNQHLNHQRPDKGGVPPYADSGFGPRVAAVRGGTVSLRDPSLLALLDKPFDPFAHVADVRPPESGQVRCNLPNLAIYLWRLKDYRLKIIRPQISISKPPSGIFVLRVNVDPVPPNILSPDARSARLFNTNRSGPFSGDDTVTERSDPALAAPRISTLEQLPDPISPARLTAAPGDYVSVETYDPGDLGTVHISEMGLQLHFPVSTTGSTKFSAGKIRGGNLCAWEDSLIRSINDGEIVVDPLIGRICIGVNDPSQVKEIKKNLLLTFTYGAVGEVGAHPISYPSLPSKFEHSLSTRVTFKSVDLAKGKTLQHVLGEALSDVENLVQHDPKALGNCPIVIEIADSFTHPLDIASLPTGVFVNEAGSSSILLNGPLIIRAADQERPIIQLMKPLAFRPAKVAGSNDSEQSRFDAAMDALFVRLEGLYLARGPNLKATEPLIWRAALNKLEIMSCTLDPEGFRRLNGTRAPRRTGIELSEPYGFATPADEREFKQTPRIVIQRSICGAIFIDEGYQLSLADSIVESIPVPAGSGGGTGSKFMLAIASATDRPNSYAAPVSVCNVTILGGVRATRIEGSGGIFTGTVEAQDQQSGCLKYCYFADDSGVAQKNRLPQNFACVSGFDARLIFTSEFFGDPAYCQLSLSCDRRILEEGPGSDQMGAFNFLLEAHKWRNLKIRFREFMPVGIRPLLIPAT